MGCRIWGPSFLRCPKSCCFCGVCQTGVVQPLIPLEAERRLCAASLFLRSLRSGTTWMSPQPPGLGRLPRCCPAVRKGLCSLGNDFWPLVSCPRGLHAGLSPQLPCQQTFCSGSLFKWDKRVKRRPCCVIGAAMIPAVGMVPVCPSEGKSLVQGSPFAYASDCPCFTQPMDMNMTVCLPDLYLISWTPLSSPERPPPPLCSISIALVGQKMLSIS